MSINDNYWTLSSYTRGRYLAMDEEAREYYKIPKNFPFDISDIKRPYYIIQGLLNNNDGKEWYYRTSSKAWYDIVKDFLLTRKENISCEEIIQEFRGKQYPTQYIIRFPNRDTNKMHDDVTKEMWWELEQCPIIH